MRSLGLWAGWIGTWWFCFVILHFPTSITKVVIHPEVDWGWSSIVSLALSIELSLEYITTELCVFDDLGVVGFQLRPQDCCLVIWVVVVVPDVLAGRTTPAKVQVKPLTRRQISMR